jgi:hypothetical protein
MALALAFFWLAAAVSVGVLIGRGIRLADEREVRPEQPLPAYVPFEESA